MSGAAAAERFRFDRHGGGGLVWTAGGDVDDPHPFLEAIAEAPEEDGPRLAYADRLDAAGDDLAAFVRADCALAACPPDDPLRPELEARRDALLRAGEEDWLAQVLGVPGLTARWDRGLATCAVSLDAFLAHHPALTGCRAVLGVDVGGFMPADLEYLSAEMWAGVRPLPRVAGLDPLFWDSWADLDRVRASPFAARLSRLELPSLSADDPAEVGRVLDLVFAADLPRATIDGGPGCRWPAAVSRAARRPGGVAEVDLSGDSDLCGREGRLLGLLREMGGRPEFAGVRSLRLRNLGIFDSAFCGVLDAVGRGPAFRGVDHLDLGGLRHEREPGGQANIFLDYLWEKKRGRLSWAARALCGRVRRVTVGIDYDWHGRENVAFLRRLFPLAEIFEDDAYPMAGGRSRPLAESW